MSALLDIRRLTKRFGGLTAVAEVDLVVPSNVIYSVIGPNGAGKTTIFNCISGFYKPDEGEIIFNGDSIQGLAPNIVATLGIARTYQNIRLFPSMTAIENILVGQHPHRKSFWFETILNTSHFRDEEHQAIEDARYLLDYVGLSRMCDLVARHLPYGAQRRLEIARSLAGKPKMLLLDEPTAGMNPQETAEMNHFIQKLRDELGITVLLIEHDMRVVMGISERVYVLDFGTKVAEGTPLEIQHNPQVIEAYLGRGAAAGLTQAFSRMAA
jgi:branched-chain amino acid transport system ATP-binding protein